MSRIGELMEQRNHAIPEHVTGRIIILAVDAVAFRPLVIISEDGEVRGLKYLKQIHDPDLFRHFLEDPEAFAYFVQRHWYEADFNLFGFQIQPIHPALRCSIVHVDAAPSSKGIPETVHTFCN
jgi:hypothetical protein